MTNFEIITLDTPGITDFAKARNELLDKSKAEWVLFLDKDEKATPELLEEIKTTLIKVPNLNGFYIKRKIIFLGKETGEDKVLRLGKVGFGKWKRAVHETWDLTGRFGTLDNYIIHSTATNLHDYIEKMNKYSGIHALENQKEGKHSNIFKIIFYPKMKFLQNFFAGRGFTFSMLQSFHSFLGWTKLWELTRKTGQAKK